jgi:transcriptional regulator with XRE-family HTH domain
MEVLILEHIGLRIKALRTDLGLTQQELADTLGVKRNTIANCEIGRNEPVGAIVQLLCKVFRVSREWLETGEGEMYAPMTRSEQIGAFFGSLLDGSVENEIKLRLMTSLSKLDQDEWELLYKIAKEWTQEEQNENKGQT